MTFNFPIVIVVLNVLATIALWLTTARKQKRPKREIFIALLHSGPILPQHRPPRTIGGKAGSLATDEVSDREREFFSDFRDFANVLNWWLANPHAKSPWRLQELPDTNLKLDRSDDRRHGRRYDIYHNQLRVGTVEISPNADYSAENPVIRTEIELEWVRLLPIYTLRHFLGSVLLHVIERDPKGTDFMQGTAGIEESLATVAWGAQQISERPDLDGDGYGKLELRFDGTPIWYFQRRQALLRQKSGAD